jgi:uncharacterized protein involved in exopolysaccharide biosynthesis
LNDFYDFYGFYDFYDFYDFKSFNALTNSLINVKVPMQQPPPYPNYPPYEEEEEINLLDYVIVLLKYKWLIFGIVFVTGVAAVIISLMLPNIYRSEATIMPRQQEKSAASSALSALGGLGGIAGEMVGLGGGGDVDKFEVVLKSRELARRVVEKYKLMPELFEDDWDPLKKDWKENPAPTIQDAYRLIIQEMLTVSRDRITEVLTITILPSLASPCARIH